MSEINWIDAFKEKPKLEDPLILTMESGDVVTGWLRKIRDDDIYYCIGNEYAAWDFEFNYDLGAVTHWAKRPKAAI